MIYGTFGWGWFLMVLMIGLPLLGVIFAILAAAGYFQNRENNSPMMQNHAPVYESPNNTPAQFARYCSNCGAGLQPEWAHCPQCGAAVQR